MHPFESQLSISAEWLESSLSAFPSLEWAEFWLNPRRLRGSDFLMRWSQGVWSEQRMMEAVNVSGRFFAIPYGPSGAAPSESVRAFELYFEELEAAGLGQVKRPDLLIFEATSKSKVESILEACGKVERLPFISEEDDRIRQLLAHAIVAIECENSLWRAAKMPAYGSELRPQRRLDGRLGLAKAAVVPTVIIKEEDRAGLLRWQQRTGLAIHVWHSFFDRAYGLSLDEAERLVKEGLTEGTKQTFQAPGGATTTKIIYKHYYHHAYPLGVSEEEPQLEPAFIEDKNGHIMPYVKFNGGRMKLTSSVLTLLDQQAGAQRSQL